MAEAGRCDFACVNSINAGQTQLINQPSLSAKQFCCSERREVKNQVYASLSLRRAYLCLPSSERREKKGILSSFDLTQEETLKPIPCCSHYNRTGPAHFLWDSACSKNWQPQSGLTANSLGSMGELHPYMKASSSNQITIDK